MRNFPPLADDDFRALLKRYSASRRDRIAVRIGNRLMNLAASRDYNAILAESVRRGLRSWPWSNRPFTEPMEVEDA